MHARKIFARTPLDWHLCTVNAFKTMNHSRSIDADPDAYLSISTWVLHDHHILCLVGNFELILLGKFSLPFKGYRRSF